MTAFQQKLLDLTVFILTFVLAAFFIFEPRVLEVTRLATSLPSPKTPNPPVELVLVGDIMLDRGVRYKVEKEADNDFRFPFLKIANEIQKADLAFGNLESQISDQGEKVGSIYSFRAPLKALEGLEFAGFDVLSLANNHALDYTAKALQDSRSRLMDEGLAPIGAGNEAQAFSPVIKNVNGTRIAFFAYTDQGPESWQAKNDTFGIAQVSSKNLEKVKADIKLAKDLADIVIISLHAGEEYVQEPTSSQINFSRAFIDAGADLVVGHHAHVVQKSEQYKDKYIFYSLGNFVFDQTFSKATMEGQLLKVFIKDKQITQVVPLKIKINDSFQPELELE